MDMEQTLTTGSLAVLAVERIVRVVAEKWGQYRRDSGATVRHGLESYCGVMKDLYDLYRKLEREGGFHSIRLLVAHNSGHDLDQTMLWKSTVMSRWPSDGSPMGQWKEQPLDHEYLRMVLKPVVDNGQKHLRIGDLNPTGPLAAMFQTHGVRQPLTFIIRKKPSEIVYATVAFTADDMTPRHIEDIRQARIAIDRWLGVGGLYGDTA